MNSSSDSLVVYGTDDGLLVGECDVLNDITNPDILTKTNYDRYSGET